MQPPGQHRARKGAACADCARRKRKCPQVKPRTTASPPETAQPLVHVPSCGESRLCLEFAGALKELRLEHTWLSMMPCRLGYDEAVDAAVRAVVKNKGLALQTTPTSANGGLSEYVKSVEVLRVAMETRENNLSDQILMAVALLCVCESLMQSEMFACFAHWGAMATILTSRPRSWQASEFSRAILYHVRNQSFGIPCARGQVSPFDHPGWLSLEPAGAATMPWEISKLKHLGNQLLIRLPRLILLVRSLQTQHDPETAEQAKNLTLELNELTDESAESKMLHRIKVVKTTNPEDVRFVPVSFDYASLGDLEAAVIYWKFRILFARIQLRLLELFGDLPFEEDKIKADMDRMAINNMMSHQYARDRQQYAHARGMVALPTAWIANWSLWWDGREDF